MGEDILAAADSPRFTAVGYGYLAHLTAATVGHTYWEHRMDIHVGEEYLTKARHLVMENDHSEAAALFD